MDPSKQLPAIEFTLVFMSVLVVGGTGRAKSLTALGGCNTWRIVPVALDTGVDTDVYIL